MKAETPEKLVAVAVDECRDRAIDDCARVLAQQGVTQITRSDWDRMVEERMRLLAAERLNYWPASKVGKL